MKKQHLARGNNARKNNIKKSRRKTQRKTKHLARGNKARKGNIKRARRNTYRKHETFSSREHSKEKQHKTSPLEYRKHWGITEESLGIPICVLRSWARKDSQKHGWEYGLTRVVRITAAWATLRKHWGSTEESLRNHWGITEESLRN